MGGEMPHRLRNRHLTARASRRPFKKRASRHSRGNLFRSADVPKEVRAGATTKEAEPEQIGCAAMPFLSKLYDWAAAWAFLALAQRRR